MRAVFDYAKTQGKEFGDVMNEITKLDPQDWKDFLNQTQIDWQTLKNSKLQKFLMLAIPLRLAVGFTVGNVGMAVAENTPKAVESGIVATKSGIENTKNGINNTLENMKNSLFENEMKEIIQKYLPKQTQTDLQIKENVKNDPTNKSFESKISISKFPNDEKRVIATINFSRGNIIEKNFRKIEGIVAGNDQNMMNLLGKNQANNFFSPLSQNDPRVRNLAQGLVNKIIRERALEGKPVSVEIKSIDGNSAQLIIRDSVAEIRENAQKGLPTEAVTKERLAELEKIEFIKNSRY